MTLDLRSSLGVSLAAHILALALVSWMLHALAPRLPRITEITLVTGGETGAGGGGKADSGVQAGVPVEKAVRAGRGGSVAVASPEFVAVGRKPRRSGERLMGATPGEGAVEGVGPGAGTGAPGAGAGRKLRYQEPLEYPDWAKEQGIDAKVTLQFKVLAAGTVDSQIIVKRTSGWRQLDDLAMKSLRNFLFEPLPPQAPQVPQWGELTFHFKPE